MAVPTLDELHRPVLQFVCEAKERLSRKQILQEMIAAFSLTEVDTREMVPSGSQTRIENRTNWAITDLKKAGLLDNPQRNQWQITESGRRYLESHQGIIRLFQLETLWSESTIDREAPGILPSNASEITPDEMMASGFVQQRIQLAEEVLDNVKSVSAESFERLVNRLLHQMGYGEIVTETGRSGDQGIDGILNQDKLGLEKVYVQAKRYTAGQVGEPEIRNFSGSLVAMGARKGVFITTSTFSSSASETAKAISMGNQFIRLIGGRELAQLLIEHGVGVVTETTYEVKKLDANYFAEL